ncbi:hypothetical protein J4218_05875 [Candidatus Pacearchaeota archaeon]|nr:hypothetical protein [Candidatus Pacearchaeota archaeon]
MVKTKEVSSVVKIDPQLLERVESFIKKDENRLKFANKKQFIDIAVHEFLKESLKGGDR